MKKLLLSGITAVALMAAGTAQAGGLDLFGSTGLARTPLAMSLAPMSFAIAVDYVGSEELFVPVRAAVGLPYGIEIGGYYDVLDLEGDPELWGLGAKWVLPPFVENLGLAAGFHYNAQTFGDFDNNGYDIYGVLTYSIPMGEGMSMPLSAGVKYVTLDGSDAADDNAFKFFASALFKAPMWAAGGEFISVDEDFDGENIDGSFWVGGRFFLNQMFTLQAGWINNVNFSNDPDEFDIGDGVFHAGVQFAFSSGK